MTERLLAGQEEVAAQIVAIEEQMKYRQEEMKEDINSQTAALRTRRMPRQRPYGGPSGSIEFMRIKDDSLRSIVSGLSKQAEGRPRKN
jgi:hypothetical protein